MRSSFRTWCSETEQPHELAEHALARELCPADPATLHNIAEALRTHGRYWEAVASYRAALEIDAEFAPAHAGLGIALFQSERYEESIGARAGAGSATRPADGRVLAVCVPGARGAEAWPDGCGEVLRACHTARSARP